MTTLDNHRHDHEIGSRDATRDSTRTDDTRIDAVRPLLVAVEGGAVVTLLGKPQNITAHARHSGASRTSPILRGVWISEVLLGERLPKPSQPRAPPGSIPCGGWW